MQNCSAEMQNLVLFTLSGLKKLLSLDIFVTYMKYPIPGKVQNIHF